jgi:hypothetical protein
MSSLRAPVEVAKDRNSRSRVQSRPHEHGRLQLQADAVNTSDGAQPLGAVRQVGQ